MIYPNDQRYPSDPQDEEPTLSTCSECKDEIMSDELIEFQDAFYCFECYEEIIKDRSETMI